MYRYRYIYTYTYICTYAGRAPVAHQTNTYDVCVCMCVCVHVCAHARAHACARACVRACVRVHPSAKHLPELSPVSIGPQVGRPRQHCPLHVQHPRRAVPIFLFLRVAHFFVFQGDTPGRRGVVDEGVAAAAEQLAVARPRQLAYKVWIGHVSVCLCVPAPFEEQDLCVHVCVCWSRNWHA